MTRLRTLLTACFLMQPLCVNGAEYWLQLHGLSHHFQERKGGEYREQNPGAGLRVEWAPEWSVQAGAYRNSIDRTSAYAIADYTPLEIGNVSGGAFAGLASGYGYKNVGALTAAAGVVVRAQVDRWSVALRATPKYPKASAMVALEIGFRI